MNIVIQDGFNFKMGIFFAEILGILMFFGMFFGMIITVFVIGLIGHYIWWRWLKK